MQRLDIFFKVELEIDASERPQKIATELERLLKRYYGVRHAEITNMVNHDDSN